MNFKDIFTYRKRALKDNEDSIVVEINGAIDSKDRIFDIFYERFDVPGYAKNWDAFLDFSETWTGSRKRMHILFIKNCQILTKKICKYT